MHTQPKQKQETTAHHRGEHLDASGNDSRGPRTPQVRRLALGIAMVVTCLGLGGLSLAPVPVCAAESGGDCFDFSKYLPDNVSIDGCWECDVNVHVWSSIFSWKFWKVTLTCTSEDGTTMTIDRT